MRLLAASLAQAMWKRVASPRARISFSGHPGFDMLVPLPKIRFSVEQVPARPASWKIDRIPSCWNSIIDPTDFSYRPILFLLKLVCVLLAYWRRAGSLLHG